ncbi:MAG: Asp23/Gls24 family envelope stress response protein [Lachnospiraceae bacterium]|nr:Asp23/Gls24 family envelope stress response protein [Lachnospiraceae bacterium]
MEERSTHTIYEEGSIGEVRIADDVVAVIAGLAAMEVDGVVSLPGNITAELIGKLGMKNLSKGITVDISEDGVCVGLNLILNYGASIVKISEKVQEKVKNAIETMTGLTVNEVNVRVASVEVKEH